MALFCLLCIACLTIQCSRSLPVSPADGNGLGYHRPPADEYAAEILSYMLQVVVGAAGDPSTREAWRTAYPSTFPNLSQVGDIMKDPKRRMSDLMVYDANILGLSKVLYHYNPRLNYFKGKALQASVYPSEELLAIRLFMVQKIARDEKVRLGSLMAQPALFDDPKTEPLPTALARANLDVEEWRLLRDVVQAEPFFRSYLQEPFLVEALHRVGVVDTDPYVKRKISAADYRHLVAEYARERTQVDVIRVAILPSMTRAFHYRDREDPGFPMGFQADDDYLSAADTLKAKLRAVLRHRVAISLEDTGATPPSPEDKERIAADIVDAHLQFLDLNDRPLVIYPGNAAKVINSLCPDADFNFIILGKNVYLSIHFDEQLDVFPAVNRIYLDIMDIGQSQSDYEIGRAGGYLFNRFKKWIVPAS